MDLETEIMTQLLNKLLIPSQREAREMVDAENDENEMETLDAEMKTDMAEAKDEDEGDAKALEDSEALREAKLMEVARFNNYIDAIYRRMNAALKAKLMDPMELNLDEKVKKNSEDKKKTAKKSRVLREAVDDVDETNEDGEGDMEVDRMGKLAKKVGNKKNDKKKGKGKSKEERKAEKERKKELRKQKKEEKEDRDGKEKDTSVKERRQAQKKAKKEKRTEQKNKKNAKKSNRQSRSGQNNKKNVRKNKNKENKNKNDNKKKGKGRGKSARKNIQNTNKNNKSKNKARKDNEKGGKSEKMVGSLSGIATMERAGDVKVEDEENHKVVTSEFSVGPLQLQVSKIYGKGKARTVKTAKAVTEVMSGTLVLKVKPDGTAHVKKVVFKKPENVEVKGKLSENNPRSLNSMRNSVNKMRPLAAMKILKTARYVLKSPTTKQ